MVKFEWSEVSSSVRSAIHHGFEIRLLGGNLQLLVGGSAAFENRCGCVDLFARAEIVEHFVNEVEPFENQITHRHFF